MPHSAVFWHGDTLSRLQINEANNSLIQEQQAMTVTAGKDDMGEDEQLQDTMLAAYWAAVNI